MKSVSIIRNHKYNIEKKVSSRLQKLTVGFQSTIAMFTIVASNVCWLHGNQIEKCIISTKYCASAGQALIFHYPSTDIACYQDLSLILLVTIESVVGL